MIDLYEHENYFDTRQLTKTTNLNQEKISWNQIASTTLHDNPKIVPLTEKFLFLSFYVL
jgi:hypothetical protein